MSHKNKYLKYKQKYLNLKQQGGVKNIYVFYDTFEEAINELLKQYNDKITFTNVWFIFGISYKDGKYHIEYSPKPAGGTANMNELLKLGIRDTKSHKFRPYVKVDDDKENRLRLLKILFDSFQTFLSIDGLAVAGKIWLGFIENCQCGKFFDFYGNYDNYETFQLFKISAINMSNNLTLAGYKKEDRCTVLYPKFFYKNSEEYLSQTFSTLIQSNYNSAKIEFLYLDKEIPITYRTDDILFDARYAKDITREILIKYFLKGDDLIPEANGVLFEKILLDSVLEKYVKTPDIVFNDEESLYKVKALFDFDKDLITNFNSLFKNFWLCNNESHVICVNKKVKCFKCDSFVCLSCGMVNQNITHSNECIICFEKHTPENLESILPN